ncbi:MAG TPA: sialate O-acetylesterase [Phycisphaerae bacterium]|nr:sialate O-acetylesterase [Phycisphaerae bacterium]HOJ75773.1 sialate O-acetylesterase [Phycisphaerae bacterium]HOM51440.1 sialate O-acetylesterase [Phycisphaerae bacterium]HON68212.1 sialate O-acetylesterase [Phycisphaerae bacterium]HPP26968.1 sialate O-acetylesterase [Phycisphaerae bacterium]
MFTSRRPRLFLAVLVLLAAPAAVWAMAPALPRVFSDNMVLQRERPIPIWGRAGAGEEITITLGDVTVTTKADAAGHWMAQLPAMPAGGPHTLVVKGQNPVTFKNVMIGEVWVCSGQSNMAWTLSRAQDAEKEIAAANHPNLRLFTVRLKTSPLPLKDVEGGPWQVCTPQTARDFSAVAYFYGRELQEKLNVPIGLINTSWGGTAIEPWTPPVGFAAMPAVAQYYDQIEQADREYIEALTQYVQKRAEWVKSAKDVKLDADDKVDPAPTVPEHALANNNGLPSVIYNAMVDPLVPYAIAGAIWYQGETNCGRNDGPLYHEKMKALIQGWRTVWDQGEFPFYYVQLAPWEYGAKNPGSPDRLPLIWEAQTATLSFPNTGMAVITDVGNTKDIHPRNKQAVGRRLALWALAKTYGIKDLVYSGPLYKSMKIEGDKIRLSFDHVGSGLASRDGKPLTWFQIAGADKRFVDAQAIIDGDTVVVSSDQVKEPVAVRFGWNELAEPNLMNREGLPASPFRTDRW